MSRYHSCQIIYVIGGVLIKSQGEIVSEHMRKRKETLIRVMGGKCALCGYNKCNSALEFHHINPSEKNYQLSSGSTRSLNRDFVEARKCILLCSNCHREVHNGLYDSSMLKSSFIEELAEIERRKNDERKTIKIYYCKECGSRLGGKTKNMLCPSCFHKTKRKCVHPNRDELKSLIRKDSFTKIGNMFGVNVNSVKKWCDNYSLPRTKREINKISDDDWEKI